MSTSDQTYKQYSFSDHGEVYSLLEQIFKQYGIQYYLIGANARDVHLYKIGVKPTRGTADVDFAIMVQSIDVYNEIFNELCDNGFRRVKEFYRLYYEKTNTAFDFLPYGQLEQESTVNFTDRNITMSVLGFKEVGENLERVAIEEQGLDFFVPPFEGLLILKLVSWSENPEARTKDLEDISMLLKLTWDAYVDEIYSEHLDLFNDDDDDDNDVSEIAARVLGRKMKPILKKNEKLSGVIISILERSIVKKTRAENPEVKLAQELDLSVEQVIKLLNNILTGIRD